MKFAVGLPVSPDQDELFLEAVRENSERIAEVYFAWPGMSSGRTPVGKGDDQVAGVERVVWLLRECHGLGFKLNLLLNASCYGADAVSDVLAERILGIITGLEACDMPVTLVTTLSPFIARTLKKSGRKIDVRASINMRVGSVESMAALSPWFDSFHIQREHNRDLALVRTVAAWAGSAGKGLSMLANSGCLHGCPVQSFHDNLVSHEGELKGVPPPLDEILLCRAHLGDPANHAALIRATWIRPEDVNRYEGVVPTMKLATRMSARPDLIIRAYCRGRHPGNLLDLLEPGFSSLFAPSAFDNTRFSKDWFDHTSRCGRQCHTCDWCAGVLEQVRVVV